MTTPTKQIQQNDSAAANDALTANTSVSTPVFSSTSASRNISHSLPPAVLNKSAALQNMIYTGTPIFKEEARTGALYTNPSLHGVIYNLAPYLPTQRRCRKLLEDQYDAIKRYHLLVRDLKSKDPLRRKEHDAAIEIFARLLAHFVTDGNQSTKILICAVPTSTPQDTDVHGPTCIARKLAEYNNHIDGTQYLSRTTAKKPCHHGGARTPEEVVKGLGLKAEGINGKAILLIDDVVTTGTNMREICRILYGLGATRVVCFGLSCTLINRNINNNRMSALERHMFETLESEDIPGINSETREIFRNLYAGTRKAFPLSPLESPTQAEFVPMHKRSRSLAAVTGLRALNFGVDMGDKEELELNPYSQSNTQESDGVSSEPETASPKRLRSY